MMKPKWKVDEKPTGTYRSFHHRGWPSADVDGQPVINLRCQDEYVPRLVRIGEHREIEVWITDRRDRKPGDAAWAWRRLKQRGKTLEEAKEIAKNLSKNILKSSLGAVDERRYLV